MKLLGSEKGFTLAELLITASLTTVSTLVGAVLLRDYLATARTLRVQADANVEMVSLLRNVTRDFQTAKESRRACLLHRIKGKSTDPNPAMEDFNCFTDQQRREFESTDGIGFNIKSNKPDFAYINSCEAYDEKKDLPRGRGGLHTPPAFPNNLNWGGATKICPADCDKGFRPVIKFLRKTGGLVAAKQIPKTSTTNNTLEMWGAVLCASEFEDLREIQILRGRQFLAQYINVLTFVARGRFDIKFPEVADPKNPDKKVKQSYVWLTGGTVLDFLDSQEMAIFR